MSSNSYIPGGVECMARRDNGNEESEVVFDLTDWVTKHYRNLLEESRRKHDAGAKKSNSFCVIFIGKNDQVFGMLETTLSRYKAYFNPAFLSDSHDYLSTD